MSESDHVQDLYRAVLLSLKRAAPWAQVSGLQEQIARLLPAVTTEGAAARRGAVAASALGGLHIRARELAERYFGETPCMGRTGRLYSGLLDTLARAAHGEDETVELKYHALACIDAYRGWIE